ncbi:MAG: MFS transporter [Anaerolineae bacterium]
MLDSLLVTTAAAPGQLTTEPTHPVARRYLKRNFILGVMNGAFFSFGDSLQDTNLVLSLFVSRLAGSNALVGLLQPVRLGGWFLPQLFVSARVQGAEAKLPYYHSGASLRIIAAFGVAAAVFFLGDSPLLLPTVLVLFATFSLAGGVSGMAFTDLVAKTIPSRMRGSFSAWRVFTGGILALAGSALVRRLLSPSSTLTFPGNYAVIFLCAATGIGIGMFSYAWVKEPLDGKVQPRARIIDQLRRASDLPRRDTNYGRFLVARICLMLAEVAAPFYIIYAKTALGLPDSIAGTYLMVSTAANIVSTYAWGRISDGIGNRAVLRGVAVLGGLAPLAVLCLPLLLSWTGPSGLAPVALFGAAFAFLGAARTGVTIGALNFLLDVAPDHDRPIYIGFTNTLVGIATLLTAVGGVLADALGYRALFALAFALYLLAGIVITTAKEPRPACA